MMLKAIYVTVQTSLILTKRYKCKMLMTQVMTAAQSDNNIYSSNDLDSRELKSTNLVIAI
jgi:hypothetical protein